MSWVQLLTLHLLALFSPSFHSVLGHYVSFLHRGPRYLSRQTRATCPRDVAASFVQSRDRRVNWAVPLAGGLRVAELQAEVRLRSVLGEWQQHIHGGQAHSLVPTPRGRWLPGGVPPGRGLLPASGSKG